MNMHDSHGIVMTIIKDHSFIEQFFCFAAVSIPIITRASLLSCETGVTQGLKASEPSDQ